MSDAMRDMIAKHRTAVGMLRTELMLADLEVDASEAAVDWDMRGLVLSRRPIGRERLPSKISSPVRITSKISASSTTSNMASAVRRFVRTMRALTDRQRDIAPHLRSDGSEPAWSVLTSSTALHLMRTAGWSVEQMLTMHRTPEGHNSADERGFTVGLACSGSDGPGMLVQAHGLGLGGGHLHFSTLTFPTHPESPTGTDVRRRSPSPTASCRTSSRRLSPDVLSPKWSDILYSRDADRGYRARHPASDQPADTISS